MKPFLSLVSTLYLAQSFHLNTHLRPILYRSFLHSTNPLQNQDTVVSICERKISEALKSVSCTVKGSHDDPNGSHIAINVVSSMFEGKSSMQRQQMVYKAIWAEMSGPVHAVDSILAKTPEEC
eukprot:gene5774-11667_t